MSGSGLTCRHRGSRHHRVRPGFAIVRLRVPSVRRKPGGPRSTGGPGACGLAAAASRGCVRRCFRTVRNRPCFEAALVIGGKFTSISRRVPI